ncbi:hypothetical protein [Stenotrophomonas sp.]|uniref:hypothetical protein n=1 Tax=Stenotrophomonas sp. TaxID=69392 RepID=UPI00289EDC2E|nr:hypothetical protein [Stenotrophomonas sp.]
MERTETKLGICIAGVAVLLAACSAENVVCGSVKPANPNEVESKILGVATKQTLAYCSVEGASCNIAAYETRGGRTVRVARVFAEDGKCLGALGDEKYFSFDESGNLQKIIGGM